MKRVRAVLFDFDFTLGDSADAIVHCSRAAFTDMGLTPPEPVAIRRTIGLTLQDSFRTLTNEQSHEPAEEYTRRYVAHADRIMTGMTTIYEPVQDVLATLRSRGVATAIVSTKYRYRIQSILAHCGLSGAVDVIVGGEDVTRHKPDPEGLHRALSGLGLAGADALYVGDHPVDGHAAARAGVRFVRVLTGEDVGDEPWAGVRPLATVADVGALPALLDSLTSQGGAMRIARFVLALCLAVLAAPVAGLRADPLPKATPESVGMSSQRLARIASALKTDIDSGRMPGAVIAVARKGKLVYYESFGFLDKSKGTPMPKDAIFSIASMTKPIVAAAALTFYEENRLLAHEPVGTYLPPLKNMSVAVLRRDGSGNETFDRVPATRQPTVQDLMRHTAGFTYGNQGTTALHKAYPGGSGNVAESMTGAGFIDALARLPLHYQPGTKWDYSYGLDILGLALESVAKQPLGGVLKDRIFGPLGMNDTAFTVPKEKASRIAKALPSDPVTGQAQSIRDQTLPWKFECGGGCLTSTALDYLRFAQMLLNRGTLDGTRVLGRKTVEYMTADQLGPGVDVSSLHNFPVEHIDGYGFGLGVAVRRVPGVAGIMGSPGDYRWSGAQGTLFWVDPKEELAVVYMAQTPGAIRAHYRQVIATLVQQAIVD